MQNVNRLCALILCAAVSAPAQGNTWNKVRYNGGTIQTKVDAKEWKNTLTITSDLITLKLKDGQSVEIKTSSVTGLSYGQEAHRRVGTMITLGILLAPLALFGLFHKTRLHFIGVEYTDAEGKKAGLLLQGHKDNYRAILMALRGATGAKVAVAEEERKYVPTGVETTAAENNSPKEAEQATGTIILASSPEGAEVFVDDAFVGNAPATLRLPAGKHRIRVTLAGHKEWAREVSVLAGSEVKLSASLARQD